MTGHIPENELDARVPALRGSGLEVSLLDTALHAAREAAEIVRVRSRDLTSLTWETKLPSDFVSEVDRAAEDAIRQLVAVRHPYATMVGEEGTPDARLDRGIVFVVDPLDGTTNFLHGFPWYAVSIGVLVDGELVAGVVLNVATDELFTARRGAGAWRDGERLSVSSITDPSRALIGTGIPFKSLEFLDDYQHQLVAVSRATAGIRRPGSAALDLCDVACGRFEAFWELMLAPWDIAAGILIIREAGGIVTDLQGNDAAVSSTPIVAGNPALHRWLLETLRVASEVKS
jgi:myo-inositol-1(or 4)-monophosphatase